MFTADGQIFVYHNMSRQNLTAYEDRFPNENGHVPLLLFDMGNIAGVLQEAETSDFRSSRVYPRFIWWAHVLSVVCIVLVLSPFISAVRQLFSNFLSFDYSFGISSLDIKYGSKNPDTFI